MTVLIIIGILFVAAFVVGAMRLAAAADASQERLQRELERESERAASLADARCPWAIQENFQASLHHDPVDNL